MDINKNIAELFSTSNFYNAVFLHAKGLKLVDIDRTNPKRAKFVFKDRSDREDLINQYNFVEKNAPSVMIDARDFEFSIKTLKAHLYQEGKQL